jgi:hypothetical protein
MTEAPGSSHLYVFSIPTKFISSHFIHADYEYAIGSEPSRAYRKIQGQKHFGRFFMFFLVCFVFDDYLTDIKLKKTSRRHEYCLKFLGLQNPEPFIEIGDTHVNGGTDPMELLNMEANLVMHSAAAQTMTREFPESLVRDERWSLFIPFRLSSNVLHVFFMSSVEQL